MKKLKCHMYRKYLKCRKNDLLDKTFFTVGKLYSVYIQDGGDEYIIDNEGDTWFIGGFDIYFNNNEVEFEEVYN